MKRLLILLFAASSLTAVGQVPDYVPTNGLLAWYPFDGNAEDQSGNGNHLTSFNVTYVPNFEGVLESAIGFPSISSKCEADLITPLQEFESYSFSFRFRIDDTWSYNTFAAFTYGGSQYSGTSQMAAFWWDENWFYGGCENSNTGYRSRVRSNGISFPFEDCVGFETISAWRHIVMTYSQDTLRIYDGINGLIDEVPTLSASSDFSGSTLRVGAHLNQPQNSNAQRQIDDLGVWQRKLSDLEAYQLLGLIPPVLGCTDSTACNFDAEATTDDGTCELSGCMDTQACNFSAQAVCDDGSCDYSCCPGPGCCSQGLFWDWELGQCFPTNPADINLDGCVQLNDLLDLLSAYGDCGAEESAWQCGDALEYQGYDYETVQIGEQCWFAENLRSENYGNGEGLLSSLGQEEWLTTSEGALASMGAAGSSCQHFHPDFDACDQSISLSEFGLLYNGYAVGDERGLCPSGWKIPSDGDFMVLELHLGMAESEITDLGWRGTNEGVQMKSINGWSAGGSGVNSSGFNVKSAGYRRTDSGAFNGAGYFGHFWTSTVEGDGRFNRKLDYAYDGVKRNLVSNVAGFSVRCLKNFE